MVGALPLLAGEASGRPLEVESSFTVRSENWLPLPADEMKRAAGDAALDRLTDTGRLKITDSKRASKKSGVGSLALEIGLIGPAETAKLTIKLDAPGSPTLVSTASITVRGLDHAGIFGALQHVGVQAADRLASKFDLLARPEAGSGSPGSPDRVPRVEPLGDPERRARFEAAQSEKRAGRYAEARTSFESVMASASTPGDRLSLMAADELRYGLLVFEAQQALVSLGQMNAMNSGGASDAALARADHLYRQIQAENADHDIRVVEANRAIDQIMVSRRALENAYRAQALSQAAGARMAIYQFLAMEGVCPDQSVAEEVIGSMTRGLEIVNTRHGESGAKGRIYELMIENSDTRVHLICDGRGVEIEIP